jgi:hypothetical protein
MGARRSADLDPRAVAFYRHVLESLAEADVPVLIGGAWAFEAHTGSSGRRTKDLDLFLRPDHVETAVAALSERGYQTEMTSPVWIAKAFMDDDYVDLIFSSGNSLCTVDDAWFDNAPRGEVLGLPVGLVPIEEMIWSKAFLAERDRFDAADVQHLILAANGRLDGDRLLARFGLHWRVLLVQIVLFDYCFPSKRDLVPTGLRSRLLEQASDLTDVSADGVDLCYGTFLSRHQYEGDISEGGFVDARHA